MHLHTIIVRSILHVSRPQVTLYLPGLAEESRGGADRISRLGLVR